MVRQGHKKSRNGCTRCKIRKIKCDERRPCGACIRWEVSCSLNTPSPSSHSMSIGASDPNPKSNKGQGDTRSTVVGSHGRAEFATHVQLLSGPVRQGLIVAGGPKFEQPHNWTSDLGLMNHYTSNTSGTLPGASRRVWEVDIPCHAVAHPFLMHQILAVSSFHLANLMPAQRKEKLSRAFQHQHHAICGIKTEILAVTSENRDALFAASSLLFIGAFASSATGNGECESVKLDDVLGVFALLRGVSNILRMSRDATKDGLLGEFMQCDSPRGNTPLLRLLQQHLPLASESFDANLVGHDTIGIVNEAIASLEESLEKASSTIPELNVAIMWPMMLKGEFLALLRTHDLAALVVVAHYCTVLYAVGDDFWFMRGWGSRLMALIDNTLGPPWQQAIEWPMNYINARIENGMHE